MASVTFIQPGSNRGVTGQTVEAFWNSISHVPLLSVGMNCALGPKEMRPLIEELCADRADLRQQPIPTPVCPIRCCRPAFLKLRNLWRRNCASGPTTAGSISSAAAAARRRRISRRLPRRCKDIPPRVLPSVEPYLALERPRKRDGPTRVELRQYRRAHQRHRLAGVRQAHSRRRFRKGGERGAPAGRRRRADHRRQHGRGHARFQSGDGEISPADRRRIGYRARAGDGRQLEVGGDRSGTQMRARQGHRQFDQPQGRRREIHRPGQVGSPLRRGGDRDGLRRAGPGRHATSERSRCARARTRF